MNLLIKLIDSTVTKLIDINNYLKVKYPDKTKQAKGKKILLDLIEELQNK